MIPELAASNNRYMESPYILAETEDFAVVYKPPLMHCAALEKQDNAALTHWLGSLRPRIFSVNGKKTAEGGLMHRLDFHTRGLVLFAKNQKTYELLQKQQEQGCFVKEYRALCCKARVSSPGFPPCPVTGANSVIESYFRAFGPGRKEVRPVLDARISSRKIAADRGSYYRTEILTVNEVPAYIDTDSQGVVYSFGLRIKRGFRHQIRCHLAWAGYPIINDPLYGRQGNLPEAGNLALCSCGLEFTGPDGKTAEYRIACPELELSADTG